LIRSRDPPTFFAVLSGIVTVKLQPASSVVEEGMKLDPAGVVTMTLTAGKVFGSDWMLGVEKPGANRLVSVVAGSRNTTLLLMERSTFDAWLGKDPIVWKILNETISRMYTAT
jgi:CRP-like cAMP-binding protein